MLHGNLTSINIFAFFVWILFNLMQCNFKNLCLTLWCVLFLVGGRNICMVHSSHINVNSFSKLHWKPVQQGIQQNNNIDYNAIDPKYAREKIIQNIIYGLFGDIKLSSPSWCDNVVISLVLFFAVLSLSLKIGLLYSLIC